MCVFLSQSRTETLFSLYVSKCCFFKRMTFEKKTWGEGISLELIEGPGVKVCDLEICLPFWGSSKEVRELVAWARRKAGKGNEVRSNRWRRALCVPLQELWLLFLVRWAIRRFWAENCIMVWLRLWNKIYNSWREGKTGIPIRGLFKKPKWELQLRVV